MKTYKKQPPRILGRDKSVKIAKQIPRAWGLATRLEYPRIKGKGAGK
jgi:hypothetical protein